MFGGDYHLYYESHVKNFKNEPYFIPYVSMFFDKQFYDDYTYIQLPLSDINHYRNISDSNLYIY